MSSYDDHYRRQAAHKDAETQRVRVEQYNYWTGVIQEVINSIMRRVSVAAPKTPDWVVEDDTRKVSWSIIKYSNPLVNLLPDGRMVTVESRPFYSPPKPRWRDRKKPVIDFSPYDKHVVKVILLDRINPATPWQAWDGAWQLRAKLCETLVLSNDTFDLPVDEYNDRHRRVWPNLQRNWNKNH